MQLLGRNPISEPDPFGEFTPNPARRIHTKSPAESDSRYDIFADFPIIIDTREQHPYEFPKEIPTIRTALATGDYSLRGFEALITFERKSLEDYWGSITHGRERFFEELRRMQKIPPPNRSIIVESSWRAAISFRDGSLINPEAIKGTTLSIECDFGIPVHFLSDRQASQVWLLKFFERFLLKIKK